MNVKTSINKLKENPDVFREMIFTELNNKYNKAIEYKKMKAASQINGMDSLLDFKPRFLTTED